MGTNHAIFNRIFTKNTFQDWVSGETPPPAVSEMVLPCPEGAEFSNKQVISDIYRFMQESYRNEYVYKNTLLNKLLLGRHSLNTSTALTEIPIEKSKADFVIINGKAVVYEIKTELDNLDRLEGQLANYYKAFDHVCVITSESNYSRVSNLLQDTCVGICVLTARRTISTKKEARPNKERLNHASMFKILRKQEYESILSRHYGELPRTTQAKYYKECLRLFCNMELEVAYRHMLVQLKKRSRVQEDSFRSIPYELKWLIYFSNYKPHDYADLERFLNKKFGG